MHLKRPAVAAAATLTMILGALAALAIPAGAKALPFGPGQASVITATATTKIVNDPDSGHGTPATWATDTLTRTVTITKGTQVPGTACGLAASAGCWSFTARLADSGTFVTIPGAGTPNQACAGCAGELIRSPAVSGTIAGNYQVTFDASAPVANASLVGKNHDDHNLAALPPFTSTTWGEQFFPGGTSFGNVAGGAYTWTYQVVTLRFPYFTTQRWTDGSGNNDGNSPGAGNIQG
jgi:hypothetical protein